MYAACRQSTADNGDEGCAKERPFSANLVGGGTAEEATEAGAEEEECIYRADDGVGVRGTGAGLGEIEVCEEAGLPDTGSK